MLHQGTLPFAGREGARLWGQLVETVADRWDQVIKKHEIDFELRLPHRGFHRAIGLFAEVKVSPDGLVLSEAAWDSNKHAWLPTESDQAYVQSLMQSVTERGRFASWIAPPARGVNSQPVDFEYVRLA